MNFSNTLIYWYLQNKRDLPWRKTKNPYLIWLSEIILQQTRVDQGLDYYLKFSQTFPTVFDLANAPENHILNLWQGLGYYSRARNLHYSAKHIVNNLNGNFPKSYAELLTLKGVGDYTASAIASICYNESTAVVDGNVYRVLARYFGIHTPINSTNGQKEFKKLAQDLIDPNNPGDHNQAIMEFGAKQCKPQNPVCTDCPLQHSCFALKNKNINTLPVKVNKTKVTKRYFNYLVINTNEQTVLQRRATKGIWQNLYEFPLIESANEIDLEDLISHKTFQQLFTKNNTRVKLHNKTPILHKLSHQHLHTKFWVVTTTQSFDESILWMDFEKFPVPILIHNFAKEFKSNEY
tara:strand:- start:158837 stop:159883 length:1047 start_codon:yes stop_codon:yes gene_type:complete